MKPQQLLQRILADLHELSDALSIAERPASVGEVAEIIDQIYNCGPHSELSLVEVVAELAVEGRGP